MHRFIFLVLAVAGLYCATFFLLLEYFDTSELKTQYVEIVKKSEKEWDAIFVKKRPAKWIGLADISPNVVNAVLISEDANFWGHNGFDWEETFEAFKTNLAKGKFARGGSTISQQVAKNVFLSNKKTLSRKLVELILALRMEKQLNKRKILEIYFNIVEFGDGIYGIRQAAYVYFNKHPSQLTVKEGAFLAMLLPNPKKYSVSFRAKELTPYARATINRIIHKLFAAHRLNGAQVMAEMQTPLSFEKSQSFTPVDTEFQDDQEEETPEPDDENLDSYSKANTASIAAKSFLSLGSGTSGMRIGKRPSISRIL
jgi:monofunctional biosynthetic peptidoglycan transglycosylase